MTAGKGVDLEESGGGMPLGKVEGGETVIRISCMGKSLFNKWGK